MAKRNRVPAGAHRRAPAGSDSGGLVYSTSLGRMCPRCRQAAAACRCTHTDSPATVPVADGTVRLERVTRGRKGAGVTRIVGLPLDDTRLRALAKRLKSACAVGGRVVDGGVIELQGDHRDRLMDVLRADGYRVKRLGG